MDTHTVSLCDAQQTAAHLYAVSEQCRAVISILQNELSTSSPREEMIADVIGAVETILNASFKDILTLDTYLSSSGNRTIIQEEQV